MSETPLIDLVKRLGEIEIDLAGDASSWLVERGMAANRRSLATQISRSILGLENTTVLFESQIEDFETELGPDLATKVRERIEVMRSLTREFELAAEILGGMP